MLLPKAIKTHVRQEKIAKKKAIRKNYLKLLCLKMQTSVTGISRSTSLASRFNQFFVDQIDKIRVEFPLLEKSLPLYTFGTMDSILLACIGVLRGGARGPCPPPLKLVKV